MTASAWWRLADIFAKLQKWAWLNANEAFDRQLQKDKEKNNAND